MYFFLSINILHNLIAIVLKDYDAAFLYNFWFLFIIIMGLLICKHAPFWQDSDTQVTVKDCGPLV